MAYDSSLDDLDPDLKRYVVEVAQSAHVPFRAVLQALEHLSREEVAALHRSDFGKFAPARHGNVENVEFVRRFDEPKPRKVPEPVRFGMSFPRAGR